MNFGTLKTKTLTCLKTFKIFDKDNSLSITNIGVMALLGKMIASPTIDWPTASALLLTLLSYNFKKTLLAKEAKVTTQSSEDLEKLKRELTELTTAFNFKNLR